MNTEKLEKSPLRNQYFVRTEKWDWLNENQIQVFDSKSPRVITMDPWPQQLYLDAMGDSTVEDYIRNFSAKYSKGRVPLELADTILEVLERLVNEEKLVILGEIPIEINPLVLKPLTTEGEIDLAGDWEGTYTYILPEGHPAKNLPPVDFTIRIENPEENRFSGTVEDGPGGTPGTGTIAGSFTKTEVFFFKNMPVSAQRDELGNSHINPDKPHPTLVYQGTFSRDKQWVTGTWKFKKKILLWHWFVIPVWYSMGQGEFRMKKKQEEKLVQ